MVGRDYVRAINRIDASKAGKEAKSCQFWLSVSLTEVGAGDGFNMGLPANRCTFMSLRWCWTGRRSLNSWRTSWRVNSRCRFMADWFVWLTEWLITQILCNNGYKLRITFTADLKHFVQEILESLTLFYYIQHSPIFLAPRILNPFCLLGDLKVKSPFPCY